jgi:hypothetical protein
MAFHLITGPSVSGIPETVPGHVPARSGLSTSINCLFPGPYFRLFNLLEEIFFQTSAPHYFWACHRVEPETAFYYNSLERQLQYLSALLMNLLCTMSCTASHTIHTYHHMYICISTVYTYSNRSYLYILI